MSKLNGLNVSLLRNVLESYISKQKHNYGYLGTCLNANTGLRNLLIHLEYPYILYSTDIFWESALYWAPF